MKISIIYYSKTGHTKEMGEEIAAGIRSEGGEARLFSIEEPLDAEYIASSDGVIFGTPTYLASTCWQMKKWFDVDSAGISLAGKLGGVYSTAHFAQGGGDIAVMTLIGHMLVKGMLIYSGGSSLGKPYIHLGRWLLTRWRDITRTAGRLSGFSGNVLQTKREKSFISNFVHIFFKNLQNLYLKKS